MRSGALLASVLLHAGALATATVVVAGGSPPPAQPDAVLSIAVRPEVPATLAAEPRPPAPAPTPATEPEPEPVDPAPAPIPDDDLFDLVPRPALVPPPSPPPPEPIWTAAAAVREPAPSSRAPIERVDAELIEDGNEPPRYPRLARHRGEQGTVVLRVWVDAQGTVTDARVARSSGHALLDDAAIAAARRWRFRPARVAGVPVAAVVEHEVEFRLREQS